MPGNLQLPRSWYLTSGNIGNVHISQGNYVQALEYYQKSLTLRETLGDKAGIAITLNYIGLVHHSQGSYAQALEYYRKSLTLSEALGDKAGVGNTLNNIGNVHNRQGNYVQAQQSNLAELKGFAEGLKKDREAVSAALKHRWSNGQVEGQINRLKMIKRTMFGRGNLDLLKARVLYSP